jgi:hypothetical protein
MNVEELVRLGLDKVTNAFLPFFRFDWGFENCALRLLLAQGLFEDFLHYKLVLVELPDSDVASSLDTCLLSFLEGLEEFMI